MLRLAIEAAKNPTFKVDATAVATSMAQKIDEEVDTKQLLKQLQ